MRRKKLPQIIIRTSLVEQIAQYFCNGDAEQGSLIGSSQFLNEIDHFVSVCGKANQNHFAPDMDAVNRQIAHWMEEGICFCGLIHSHPNGAGFLSQYDYLAIESWVRAAKLPFLCFGIVDDMGYLRLYLAYQEKTGNVRIKQMIRITDSEDSKYAQWRIKDE